MNTPFQGKIFRVLRTKLSNGFSEKILLWGESVRVTSGDSRTSPQNGPLNLFVNSHKILIVSSVPETNEHNHFFAAFGELPSVDLLV